MAVIGIDLHSDRITVARLISESGKLSISKDSCTFGSPPFQRFLESLHSDDYVLIENTFNAFWFHDLITDRVKACYVYETNQLRSDGNKNDKIDAEKLAKRMAYYITMGGEEEDFATVYVPAEKVRELRGLLSTYQLYNKIKVQMKNRIHSILKQNGICIRKDQISTRTFEKWIEGAELAQIWKDQMRTLLASLKDNEEQQQEVKDMIYLRGDELFGEQIELLLSIRGFSVFTAIVLMSDVVDVERFSSAKKFCSYLQTVPKTKASNQTVHVGAVNRRSRSGTCALLTQSVLHFSRIEPHISEFCRRVRVGKSAGKARLATIRKILVCAYNMLKKNELFYWTDGDLYMKKLKEYHRDLDKLTRQYEEVRKTA
jgi:transposase